MKLQILWFVGVCLSTVFNSKFCNATVHFILALTLTSNFPFPQNIYVKYLYFSAAPKQSRAVGVPHEENILLFILNKLKHLKMCEGYKQNSKYHLVRANQQKSMKSVHHDRKANVCVRGFKSGLYIFAGMLSSCRDFRQAVRLKFVLASARLCFSMCVLPQGCLFPLIRWALICVRDKRMPEKRELRGCVWAVDSHPIYHLKPVYSFLRNYLEMQRHPSSNGI